MFPHEMQAVMAKILFFIFAILILCFSKVRAGEVTPLCTNGTISASFVVLVNQ